MAGLGPQSKPASQQNLQAALASVAAPANPKTPDDRTDPAETSLLDQQRIRRSLEIAKEGAADGDPMRLVYGAFHATITRLRDGAKIEDAVDVCLTQLFPIASPTLKAALVKPMMSPTPQGPGAPGAPSAGMSPPAPVGPIGGTPPGAPVSPGPPGQ